MVLFTRSLLLVSLWVAGVNGKAQPSPIPAILEAAQAFTLRAEAFEQRSQPDSAALYWQRAADRCDRHRQTNAYWSCRSRQAVSLAEADRPDQALALADSVQTVARQLLGPDNLLEAESEIVRGITARAKSQYTQALTHQERALSIRQQRLGKDHVRLADSYVRIGSVHYFLDHDSLARVYFQQALALRLPALGEQHVDVAKAYHNLMSVSYYLGEPDAAIAYGEKARSILTQTIGEDNGTYADVLSMLAITYGSQGDLDRTLQLHRQTLAIAERVYGRLHPKTAKAYQFVGWAYENKDDFTQALAYERQALQCLQQLYGDDHPQLIVIHHHLGATYKNLEDYPQALRHFQRNLELHQRYSTENKAALVLPYQNLGRVKFSVKQYKQADDYYQQALQIQLATRGEKHLYTMALYADLVVNFAQAGQLEPALSYLEQVLRVARLIHGEKHADVARSYYELAVATARRGDNQTALQFIQQTLQADLPHYQAGSVLQNPRALIDGREALSRSQLWNALHLKMNVLRKLAQTEHDRQFLTAGWETYRVLDTLMTDYWRAGSDNGERAALTRVTASIYNDALPISLRLSDRVAQSFELAQKGKAILLTAALTEAAARRSAGIPDSLLRQEKELRVGISRYEQLLARPDSAGTDRSGTGATRTALFEANRRFNELMARLERDYPRYYRQKYQTAPVTVAQYQQRLGAKTALIEYALTDSLVVAFVLTKGSLRVHTSRSDSLLVRRLGAFRVSILERDQLLYNQLGHSLYQQLFPFSLPAGITDLLIVPAGELAGIPFEALLTGPTRTTDERSKPYLLRRFAVRYAYSAKLWYQGGRSVEPTTPPTLLALAPVFAPLGQPLGQPSGQPVLASAQTRQWLSPAINAGPTTQGALQGGQYVQPLPATEAEVTTLAQLITRRGGRAKVLLREQAREDTLKAQDLSAYRYVHIATHGLLADRPELSGLLMTQDSTSAEDGILYSGELYHLNLNADLVVLSACETGLGQIMPGEGVMGLSRALLYAGTRNLVVSLWRVSDNSSAQLMTGFYTRLLASAPQTNALQQAKLSLLASGQYASPYHWAAFTLISGGQ